jgi:tetratricopeptide (TPR) repeat protein
MISQAWAFPSQALESIEYLEYKGAAAIEIGFTQPIQYVSNFPLNNAATIQVFIGPRIKVDSAVDRLPYTYVMRAPDSNEIPLSQVTFKISENGELFLDVEFERVVKFSVLAGSQANTLLITLPEYQITSDVRKESVKESYEVSGPGSKLLEVGKTALKDGDNNKAIQIFTKMLGMPDSKERQEALELLGVARERNNQKAHAKAIYTEYLKQYPKTEGAARVKQRLNDLLYGQLKPRKKLKVTNREEEVTSAFFGSFAQYYYRGQNSTDLTGTTVDQSLLLSQISLNWSIRGADYDVRNFIYANHSHDYISKVDNSLTAQTAYTQFKNSKYGFSGRLGRQTGSKGGVLGKFDGLQASYDMTSRLSINAVTGYPVDISNKRSIQTRKPFWGLGFELDGKGMMPDILPYYIRQNVDGIVDREAVGSEFRHFGDKGNYYSLIDYDVAYSDLNLFILRGQYKWTQNTMLNFNYDYRNSPLLFTSDALIGRTDATTVEQLLKTYTEDQIRTMASERIGNATTLSTGISHKFSPLYQINTDITFAQGEYMVQDPSTALFTSQNGNQTYLSTQLIANKWLSEHDTTLLGLRLSSTDSYDESSLYISNRLPIENSWKLDTRYRVDFRKNGSGEKLLRQRPSIKLNYRYMRTMTFELETGVEFWHYSGTTNNVDYRRVFAIGGYNWNF